jgi:GH18 family chitinase
VIFYKNDINLIIKWIALGGWTMNDVSISNLLGKSGTRINILTFQQLGSTQKSFSSMAKTAMNRGDFIRSLMSFMREYSFDGVDFDWYAGMLHENQPFP